MTSSPPIPYETDTTDPKRLVRIVSFDGTHHLYDSHDQSVFTAREQTFPFLLKAIEYAHHHGYALEQTKAFAGEYPDQYKGWRKVAVPTYSGIKKRKEIVCNLTSVLYYFHASMPSTHYSLHTNGLSVSLHSTKKSGWERLCMNASENEARHLLFELLDKESIRVLL